MRPVVRTAAKLGAVSLIALSAVAVTGGSAQANTYTYDGADPASTYCGGTTSTPSSATITYSDGSYAGTISLRYNSGCRTVWAKITIPNPQTPCGTGTTDHDCAKAVIHRDKDGAELSCSVPAGSTSCYTNMLNDANMTSYAYGILDAASMRFGYTSHY